MQVDTTSSTRTKTPQTECDANLPTAEATEVTMVITGVDDSTIASTGEGGTTTTMQVEMISRRICTTTIQQRTAKLRHEGEIYLHESPRDDDEALAPRQGRAIVMRLTYLILKMIAIATVDDETAIEIARSVRHGQMRARSSSAIPPRHPPGDRKEVVYIPIG